MCANGATTIELEEESAADVLDRDLHSPVAALNKGGYTMSSLCQPGKSRLLSHPIDRSATTFESSSHDDKSAGMDTPLSISSDDGGVGADRHVSRRRIERRKRESDLSHGLVSGIRAEHVVP